MARSAGTCQMWTATEVAPNEAVTVMHSALYAGQVGHRRETPVVNAFRYSLFMVYLDLDELEDVFAGRWFWGVERPAWASFRRADHLRRPGPLDLAVRDVAEQQLGFRPLGPIRILTQLRYLGYCFNPISIYYCYSGDGLQLEAIVTEVHNTPWGEEHLRALDTRHCCREDDWHVFALDKEFHVSPFMPMDIHYTWKFTAPGETLGVHMQSERNGEKIFAAWLELQRRPITGQSLAQVLAKWPAMTAKVIAAIYWQALRIKLKGVPYCPHPD